MLIGCLAVLVSLLAAYNTVVCLWKLMQFLSPYTIFTLDLHLPFHAVHEKHSMFVLLLFDVSLLALFIFSHTLLSSRRVLPFFKSNDVFARPVYVLASTIALQVLIQWWQPISSVVIWRYEYSHFYLVCHVLAWIYIYAGCVLTDIGDLIGVKQVYYWLNGWKSPSEYNSQSLERFLSHYRHPGLLGLLAVLWIHPVMTLGRLILAVGLPIYYLLQFSPTQEDYQYQKYQYERKSFSLRFNGD